MIFQTNTIVFLVVQCSVSVAGLSASSSLGSSFSKPVGRNVPLLSWSSVAEPNKSVFSSSINSDFSLNRLYLILLLFETFLFATTILKLV